MAAQSTLKSCSACKGTFTSYHQHSPFAAIPHAKTLFPFITNLTFERPDVECVQENGIIRVASTKPSNDDSISCSSLVPHSGKASLIDKGAYPAVFYTGASITRLPTELLILVFQSACSDVKDWLTALALSLVSRDWRSIVHALPELWTHIFVDFEHAESLELVWWYIHLSRDAPLEVKMHIIGDGEYYTYQAAGLLVMNATRWRWAHILWIKNAGVPMLESLKFHVLGNGSNVKRCEAFRDAPRLREYAPGGVSPTQCVVAWDQLKTVAIRDFYDADLYEYLRDAEAMEELVVDEECFFGTPYGGMSIPLSAERLTMRSVPCLVDITFMDAFVLPSLTVVDICIVDGSAVDAFFVPSFVGMLKRSGCSLLELRVHNVPLDDEALLDILACTPRLQALTIHEPAKEHCITNAFLLNLVLPELRMLELVWSYDADEEHVLDMVERMKGLEAVVLGRRFGWEVSERSVERMNVLRGAGVNVTRW
ncbi:hypothetical protein BDZ89DRAFT_1253589 [Hymenopellis radicata]|nr:hypothetical protein BDZ89DRAFT_1253589 [Hymenopellis radicata]